MSLSLAPDLGPPEVCQRSGVCVMGAMPYVTNFNMQIEGASLDACREAAKAMRGRFGVQVMALPHEVGTVEIGCNLQASVERDSPPPSSVQDFVAAQLPAQARFRNSYVVGLTPSEALQAAQRELQV